MSNSDFEHLENNNTFTYILGDTDYYRLRPGELCFTFPIHVWNAALNSSSTNSMTTQSANSNVSMNEHIPSMNETILDSNGLPSEYFAREADTNAKYAARYHVFQSYKEIIHDENVVNTYLHTNDVTSAYLDYFLNNPDDVAVATVTAEN